MLGDFLAKIRKKVGMGTEKAEKIARHEILHEIYGLHFAYDNLFS